MCVVACFFSSHDWDAKRKISLVRCLIFVLPYHCNCYVTQVEPNAHRIEEHRRKYERLHKEREDRKAERERQRRRAKAQVTMITILLTY